MNDICPYCGNRAFKTHIHSFELIGSENDLIIFNGTSLGSRVIYECQNCGLLFTQEQIDWEMKLQRAKASAKDTGRPCLRREEDVLKGARKLMADKQWYFARDVLDKFCYPYEHPLEFMIYRCICTVWSRFNNNEDNLLERWESLTVLRYNLKRACDLLPRDDEDKLYQANLSIQQALGTLDISSYEYVQNKNWKVVLCETGYILTDRTKAAIAEIMCTYAEHLELEAFAHDRHSLDYLKLAVKTWNNCLKNAANSRLSCSELETLAIPVTALSYMYSKIDDLNVMIRRRDPKFKAVEASCPIVLSGVPDLICRFINGVSGILLCAFLCLIIPFAVVHYGIQLYVPLVNSSSSLPNSLMHNAYITFTAGMLPIVYCILLAAAVLTFLVQIKAAKAVIDSLTDLLCKRFGRKLT